MKKLFLLLITFSILSFSQLDGILDQIIKNASSETLKNKLRQYEQDGIQKSIEVPAGFSGDSIVKIAKTYLGTPHVMGGTSHKGIDCSGLVFASFQHFGVEVNARSSQDWGRYGRVIVDKDSLKVGDLLFFTNSYSTSNLMTHAGFYLGNDSFIHTSASEGVVITPLSKSNYWNSRYLFGTRISHAKETFVADSAFISNEADELK
jgi:murein DD-endopeptidase / murein LD-carboxypeptidase